MFERFTDSARQVLVLAQEEARLLDHSFIGTEHVLVGLLHTDSGTPSQVLTELGASLPAVRDRVKETIGLAGSHPTGSPPFTPRAKKVLELSLREALQLGHHNIGPEHLLLGLLRRSIPDTASARCTDSASWILDSDGRVNCPSSVRELLPTRPNLQQHSGRAELGFIGTCRFWLMCVGP